MKETNDEDMIEQSRPVGHSRRHFIVSAATAVTSVGAANLLNLQPVQEANANNSAATGNGPYPTGKLRAAPRQTAREESRITATKLVKKRKP
jgi:hypothetical protein